jgi:hypothetical protein
MSEAEPSVLDAFYRGVFAALGLPAVEADVRCDGDHRTAARSSGRIFPASTNAQ